LKPQIRTRINRQIRAREVRVIEEGTGNLGVMPFEEALARAQEKKLDIIEISPNAKPPITKIMDFGKFQYEEKKKQKKTRGTASETKTLQVKIGTGEHDLALKAKRASEFLKEGHRVKIDLFLAGRAKYLQKDFLNERLERIMRLISEEYKITDGPKKSPKGLTVLVERK
jgi:translation initiation factor IF-3